MLVVRKNLLWSLLLLVSSVYAQYPLLLKDINLQADPLATSATLGSDPRFLTNHNGILYFTAKQNGSTVGLWKSSGRNATTAKVLDLPGTAYSLTSVGSSLYFVADQTGYGYELWKSNGTAAGTTRVKDINDGPLGSMPSGFTNVNGTLYFVATTAGAGSELWKSGGTDATTVIVRDIVTGAGSSNPQQLTNVNGTLYFVANDGANGYELWKTNGTAAGTILVKDINAGIGSSNPQYLTNLNGTLYFTATNGANGFELWKSDGTAAGTVQVRDIWSGSMSGMPHYLTALNSTLYFAANDGQTGIELWKSNGTAAGTVLAVDIQTGSGSSDPRNLKVLNGLLYFSATNGEAGQELWRSDGTAAGTKMVKNIRVGGEGSNSTPSMFNLRKGIVYFTAYDDFAGRELWQTDGTEAATNVLELYSGTTGSGISNLTVLGDTLFFTADDGKKGSEIWKIEACMPLRVASDTTICHKGPLSLPAQVANYGSFTNPIWRKGSYDGPIVTNPTSVMLDSLVTTFYLEAQHTTGCTSTAKVTFRTISMPESVGSIRVLLEGAYRNGIGSMTTILNQQGLLPGQTPVSPLATKTPAGQPYVGAPWYYMGNETVSAYDPSVTDWVLVSLRTDPSNPATTVFRAAALLQNDGLVPSIQGCPSRLKEYTNYYVAVEHRNHLPIVAATPTLFVNGGFFYDFGINQSYIPANAPAVGQKMQDTRYMMYAGDIVKGTSAEINANDMTVWTQTNGSFGKYLVGDINLDGEVNALDRILWIINNGLFSGVRF